MKQVLFYITVYTAIWLLASIIADVVLGYFGLSDTENRWIRYAIIAFAATLASYFAPKLKHFLSKQFAKLCR